MDEEYEGNDDAYENAIHDLATKMTDCITNEHAMIISMAACQIMIAAMCKGVSTPQKTAEFIIEMQPRLLRFIGEETNRLSRQRAERN